MHPIKIAHHILLIIFIICAITVGTGLYYTFSGTPAGLFGFAAVATTIIPLFLFGTLTYMTKNHAACQ
jgi:hypothetical protein